MNLHPPFSNLKYKPKYFNLGAFEWAYFYVFSIQVITLLLHFNLSEEMPCSYTEVHWCHN